MNAQTSLEKSGIPCSFGVWRSKNGKDPPPDAYIVYTQMRVEDSHADDAVQDNRLYAYPNLWSVANPNTLAAKVREAMYADGWSMVEELTEYVEDAKRYRVSWTWAILEDAQNAAGD